MNYWLVRSKWGETEDKKSEFINNDEWINGYKDKYIEIVNRVETEDILLLTDNSTITHYGICIENPQDGRYLNVDKWMPLNEPIYFSAKKGSHLKSIIKINDEDLIKVIEREIENTNLIHDIKIKNIIIDNFTVFKNQHNLEFSDNLNIIIGENGTGKTHLLKLLYSIITGIGDSHKFYGCSADYYDPSTGTEYPTHQAFITEIIESKLLNIFKADSPDNFLHHNKKSGFISLNLEKFFIKINLDPEEGYPIIVDDNENLSVNFCKESCIFIPAKEMLSFYEGFIPLYENRENSFDESYYHLAKSLALAPLKNIASYPDEVKLLNKLEQILEGKLVLERGRFYLSFDNGNKTEIALIAEGLRKIATIAQLIANGSLNKNSILFWDEPETNLNPRLIKKMAELLVELSRSGMQIFIATHSLFLIKEIEILRNQQDKFKYFSFGFNEEKEIRISQNEDFEYLDDVVILDEELEQDDRFMNKEEDV